MASKDILIENPLGTRIGWEKLADGVYQEELITPNGRLRSGIIFFTNLDPRVTERVSKTPLTTKSNQG